MAAHSATERAEFVLLVYNCFARKVSYQTSSLCLCASVVNELFVKTTTETQRHRGWTEKSDFSCKATSSLNVGNRKMRICRVDFDQLSFVFFHSSFHKRKLHRALCARKSFEL